MIQAKVNTVNTIITILYKSWFIEKTGCIYAIDAIITYTIWESAFVVFTAFVWRNYLTVIPV